MPHLPGKHGNLSAMVSVMSDEISEKNRLRLDENLCRGRRLRWLGPRLR
jgi:hypothetical protein